MNVDVDADAPHDDGDDDDDKGSISWSLFYGEALSLWVHLFVLVILISMLCCVKYFTLSSFLFPLYQNTVVHVSRFLFSL